MRRVTSMTLEAEPACPTPAGIVERGGSRGPLSVERRLVRDIPRESWDALAARNPWSTPFSSWAFQRAWWDAYAANAHDETVVVCPSSPGGEPIAIVPLMHRHEVEPGDELTQTKLRHGGSPDLTPVPPTATAIFFGASYHADYATILADPADLPRVADAVVASLADRPDLEPWDVVDLRRLRCGDPAADALAGGLRAHAASEGWTVDVEREDVCPVVTLPVGADIETYLGSLSKKTRHEIRRKVRRAEGVGPIRLEASADPLADLETFIELHQKRWGVDGLFPDTPGGDQSRVLVRRMFELCGADGPIRLSFLRVGDKRIAAGIHIEDANGYQYYNAGIDPDAFDLSPGVLLVYAYIRQALERGISRFDFLRGDEPYKYEWGAVDEPIQRILVRRGDG
jgi:CelD/BcsL family acetyltransferase involved in cellulose biosynthesis